MMLNLLTLINLLGYAFVVSQPLFYLLAMADAQKRLQAPAYVELRHPDGLLFITYYVEN